MKKMNLKENQKLIIMGVFLFITMLGIVGYTYSFFQTQDKDTGTITGTVASVSLSLEINKLAPDITDEGLIPQLDEYITSAVVGKNNKNCVDDNNNIVCQVYEAIVTNNSSVSIQVDGLLELNAGNNPNLKWSIIDSYEDGMTTNPNLVGEIKTHEEKVMTSNETYNANETKRYYIVIWISETDDAQTDTGIFTGTITFKDHEETVTPGGSGSSLATLTSLGLTSLLQEGTPDFSVAATTEEGIYAAEDDLGTSYYFRGASDHNYVLFDNKYWRIIRINGDGSVRVIYDGTSAHEDGESSTDRQVTTKAFNSKYSDNAFVGYMNGTTDGKNFPNGTTNSVSYTEAHTNTTDSTIKNYLENTWYATISEANREYIVDAIYCNDREVSSANSSYTGDGSAKTKTWYKASERLVTNASNATPVLTCSQKDDRFTLESSNFEIETNGKLDAPVGLITADEMVMAGGTYNSGNSGYYLYSGNYYWTMSPHGFDGSIAYAFDVGSSDGLGSYNVYFSNDGVRPVLSLNSSALQHGSGKIDDPFRISN